MRDHYGALRVLLRAAGGGVREGADLSPEWYKTYGYGPEHEFFPNRSAALPEGWTPTYDPSQHFGANPTGQGSTNAGAGVLGTVAGLIKNGRAVKNIYDSGTKLYDQYFGTPANGPAGSTSWLGDPGATDLSNAGNQETAANAPQGPAGSTSWLGDAGATALGGAGLGALATAGAAPAGTVAVLEGAQLAGLTGGAAAGAGAAGAAGAGAAGAAGAGAAGAGAAGAGTGILGAGGVSGAVSALGTVAPIAAIGFALTDYLNSLGSDKGGRLETFDHESGIKPYMLPLGRTAKFYYQLPDGRLIDSIEHEKLYGYAKKWGTDEGRKAYNDYLAGIQGIDQSIVDKLKASKYWNAVGGYARGGLSQLGDHMPFNPRMGALQQMMGGPAQSRGTPSYYTYGANSPPQQPPMGPPQGMPPQGMPAMAGGGAFGYAGGGGSPKAARLVKGPGTGRSDDIPARLSDGEYVFDAETVALLGDGSTDEGARRLDALRTKLRMHKGKKLAKGKFSAKAKTPESYME